jgi:hypothetical protein
MIHNVAQSPVRDYVKHGRYRAKHQVRGLRLMSSRDLYATHVHFYLIVKKPVVVRGFIVKTGGGRGFIVKTGGGRGFIVNI